MSTWLPFDPFGSLSFSAGTTTFAAAVRQANAQQQKNAPLLMVLGFLP
jgi:hypothetical protein